jgi:hypothetical protein
MSGNFKVMGIGDRLHVTPSTHMGDGAILNAVRDALLHAPGLQNCTIQVKRKGTWETVREAVSRGELGVILLIWSSTKGR